MSRRGGALALAVALHGGRAWADRITGGWDYEHFHVQRAAVRTGEMPPMPPTSEAVMLATLGIVCASATLGFAWMAYRRGRERDD